MSTYQTLDYTQTNTFIPIYDENKKEKLYECKNKTFIRVKNNQSGEIYKFIIKPLFRTNGGSIPKMFQWFAKPWDWNNVLYNLAYVVHDGIYGSKCLSRSTADDILRSILRDSGMNRFHASTICWSVNTFACSHYGLDDLDNEGFFELIIETNEFIKR